MTIDDLATMVAKGFEQTATKQDLLNLVTKEDFKKEIEALKKEMQALKSTVNSYLDKWLKLLADKLGVEINLGELEKF